METVLDKHVLELQVCVSLHQKLPANFLKFQAQTISHNLLVWLSVFSDQQRVYFKPTGEEFEAVDRATRRDNIFDDLVQAECTAVPLHSEALCVCVLGQELDAKTQEAEYIDSDP